MPVFLKLPRTWHRRVGMVMLLPFVAWSLTGLFFLVQPGYGDAYATLPVKTYASTTPYTIPANPEWRETRYLVSILGPHLLARTNAGWQHLNAADATPWQQPDATDVAALLADAISFDVARYGRLEHVDGMSGTTDTGVELSLNWASLTLQQYGRDTRWIDRLYSIHYLQWTGIDLLDRLLGLIGLVLLLLMTYTGARLLFGTGKP